MTEKRIVCITDVCSSIFAGGDAPKKQFSFKQTKDCCYPVFSNGESNNGLYGYTNTARVTEPSITVSARGTIGFTAIRLTPFTPIVRLISITPIQDIIDIDYLYYALSNYTPENTGTSIPQLTVPMIKKYKFRLPEKEEQKRAVKLLKQIDDILEKEKKQIQKLDELIKSRFVEMFGDPIINPYNWDELLIANVLRGKASNGFFAKRDEYCDNGNVSILGVTNIVNRMYSNCDNLPKTNANNTSIEKYRVQYGDMLFCRSSLVAEGIGKASIVPTNIPDNVLFECHVIRLPLDTNKVIPEFLQVLTSLDYFRNQVLASAKTATMTTIGQDGILKCNIILPPYIMQQEYLTYISRIKKTKSAVNQSIEKLETLKKSLMQEYFG